MFKLFSYYYDDIDLSGSSIQVLVSCNGPSLNPCKKVEVWNGKFHETRVFGVQSNIGL
jgi:hypothetical protein